MSTPTLEPEGNLAEHDLPDLVQQLQQQSWTGLLTLHRGSANKGITVEKGRMVFGTSSDPDDRMGVVLLRRGQLSLRQLTAAGAKVAPGKRLGSVLVEQGLLAPKALVRAVVDHTREIILRAFTWSEGRYTLEPGERPEEAITLNIDPPQLILEGVRRIESWMRIDRATGGLQARYRSLPEGAPLAQKLELDGDERALLERLAEPRSLGALCDGSKLSSFNLCRLVWALKVIGVIQRMPEAELIDDDGLGAVL